jgi:hypothetical protein
VATDVAARGLHIAGVEHVINYDFPLNVQVRGVGNEKLPSSPEFRRQHRSHFIAVAAGVAAN